MRLRNGKNVEHNPVPPRKNYAKRAQGEVSKKAPAGKKRCTEKNSNLQDAEIGDETSYRIKLIKDLESFRRKPVDFWVQCDDCGKWRKVESDKDPQNYHHIKWLCSMNSDTNFASCEIPEQDLETREPCFESEYVPGNLAWAKCTGFPWWPGMVEEFSETLSYCKVRTNEVVPYKYHVTFLHDGECSYDWLSPKNIKPFRGNFEEIPHRMSRYQKLVYSESLKDAFEFYKAGVPLSLDERLARYSYTSWYKEKYFNNRSNSTTQNPSGPSVICKVNTPVNPARLPMKPVEEMVCIDTGNYSSVLRMDEETYRTLERVKNPNYRTPPEEDDEVEVTYMNVEKQLHVPAAFFKYWMNVALGNQKSDIRETQNL